MLIVANGKKRAVRDGAMVSDLLQELKLEPLQVFIEHNGAPLEREDFGTTALREGDKLEIAQMVGGG
jgi:sulfur carrier protein